MHLISSTFHSPSVVVCSLACSFQDSDERYLVVLKSDKLQIYVLKLHGVELVSEKEIWGLPRGLIQLEPSKHLVVSLDVPHAKILILEFKTQTSELLVHHTSSISPPALRPSVGFSGILGSAQTVCASFYNGHVKVMEASSKAPYEVKESDLRVHELTIRTMCFTLPTSDAILAIVYTDHMGCAWIIGRTANTMDPSIQLPEKQLETIPDLAVPIRVENTSDEDTFGILLFSPKLATFIKTGISHTNEDIKQTIKGKGRSKTSRSKSEVRAEIQAGMVNIELPFNEVAAWTQIDGKHLVVGDSFGRLYLLAMSMSPQFTMSHTLLGEVSVPSTISYLSNNILYVGSLSAPSQLVRISDEISGGSSISHGKKKQPDDEVGAIEVMVTHNENIAPIMDATLVDMDGSGQSRIATISGDDAGGWLNIIHKGASFRELAVLDGSANLEDVFPLKKYFDAVNHTYLVASTNTATFLLALSEASLTLISPGELPGISRTARTILIANVALPGIDAIVHITPNNVTLVDLVTGRGISSWNPPKGEITAAAVETASSAACIATSDGRLYCISMQAAGFVKASDRNFNTQTHPQISALAVHGRVVAASFWGSNEIILLSLPDLKKLEHPLPAESSAASALCLSNLGEEQMYLIAARLDGTLVIQGISPDGAPLPGSRRAVPLGGGPIHMTTTPATESSGVRVIAAGKRAAAVSVTNKRLMVSSLPISDVCALSAVNAPGIGPSILYASAAGLIFGQIEQLNKLNITSFHLGSDSPLRLAHHTDLSTYIVGCMRVGTDTSEERHMIRFIDDSTFKDLGQIRLRYSEMVTSVTTYTHGGTSCVLVGTGVIGPAENEPQSGRIIVFKVEPGSSMFKLVTSKEVDGAVSSIKQFKERIIAAINYGVYVFNLTREGSNISEPIAKWERGYVVDDVIIREQMIVVGDKLRSVSVLRLVQTSDLDDSDVDMDGNGDNKSTNMRLETVAMDMHAIWPTSIEVLSDNKTIVAAQLDGNILTWELDQGNLELRAAFHIGEVINRFIVLPSKGGPDPQPVALFVTNTGRIATLSTVDDSDALQLTRLEMKMGDAIKGLGGIKHADWRAPKFLHSGTKPPPRRGITDGDFIKKFLELDPGLARKILTEGSAAETIHASEEEQIRRCLEALSTEH